MSSNFLLNTSVENTRYRDKIDIYEDAIREMLKIKKKSNFKKKTVSEKNSKELNSFEDKKKLMDLEKSYKKSLILLDIMQKKIENDILQKYNIERSNKKIISDSDNKVIHNILIKKNS